MRADAIPLELVLGERQQWVVPVYQRHYEWETGEDRQIPKLWEDLKEEALERLEARTNQVFGAVRRRFLVDGQQRITTFQLVLNAIREVARQRNLNAIST